jgi:plasmid maintenance system antidote protein VapI
MTPNQLRTALARLGLSQRGAARLLGIDERTMRKYVAGDLVIPEMMVWALRGLASATKIVHPLRPASEPGR